MRTYTHDCVMVVCVYYCPLIGTARISHACIGFIPTEVVEAAANQEFARSTDDLPSTGSRKADVWSVCFQGGTFDRVKERCIVWPPMHSIDVCTILCTPICSCVHDTPDDCIPIVARH